MKIALTPVKWVLLNDHFFGVNIYIEKREQHDGKFKYSVMSGSQFFLNEKILEFCLNEKDSDVFLKETRFNNLKTALNVYKKFIKKCLRTDNQNYTKTSYSMAIQYKYLKKIIDNIELTEKRKKFKL